jgi:hypothetical protein
VGLHDILSPIACTLKVLDLTVASRSDPNIPLWLCKELEAMAGHIALEALSFELCADDHEAEDLVVSIIQEVVKVFVKPGWSALRQVSFKFTISCWQASREDGAKLFEVLQSLPDKYLSHLPRLESVAFNYSTRVFPPMHFSLNTSIPMTFEWISQSSFI